MYKEPYFCVCVCVCIVCKVSASEEYTYILYMSDIYSVLLKDWRFILHFLNIQILTVALIVGFHHLKYETTYKNIWFLFLCKICFTHISISAFNCIIKFRDFKIANSGSRNWSHIWKIWNRCYNCWFTYNAEYYFMVLKENLLL